MFRILFFFKIYYIGNDMSQFIQENYIQSSRDAKIKPENFKCIDLTLREPTIDHTLPPKGIYTNNYNSEILIISL